MISYRPPNPSIPTDFEQIWSEKNTKRQKNSFKLKWATPKEDIHHFEIICDIDGVGLNPVHVKGGRRTAEIIGLEAGTRYNCSISAVLRNGQISDRAKCIAYTAPGSPLNMVQTKASTNGLYLRWMPASGGQSSGGQSYVIRYRSIQETGTNKQDSDNAETQTIQLTQKSGSDKPAREESQVLLDNAEETASDSRYEKITTVQDKYNLENLVPGTNYEIRIFAIAHDYPSLPLELEQATKPGKPGEVTIEKTLFAELISLSWGESEGNVTGYEIEYGRDDNTTRQPLKSSASNCTIDNILPGVNYSYKVYAVSNGKRGDPSHFIAATDPEEVHDLTWDTSSNTLTWERPDGDVDSYDVTVQTGTDIKPYHTTTCSQTLQDVKKGEPYVFSVVAISNGKASKKVSKNQTIAPGTPEFEKEKTSVTSTSVTLHWTLPGGKVKQYALHHQPVDEDMNLVTRWWNKKTDTVKTRCKTLENLTPGIKYRFEVFAEVDGARDEKGDVIEVVTAPSKPVVNYEASTNSFKLSWNRINEPSVDKITVAYTQGDIRPQRQTIKDVSVTSWSINNLQPGTPYQAEVFFHCGDKASSCGLIDITTDPVPPETFYTTSVSTSTANIEWSKPNGQYDHMVVTFNDLTSKKTSEKQIKELKHRCTNLHPASWYRLSVVTVKGSKRSAIKSYDFCTAPLPPKDISINPQAHTANIQWGYPNKRRDDGIRFEIKYWEVDSNGCEKTVFSETLQTTLESLTPGSQYLVQVRAVFHGTKNEAFKGKSFITEPPSVTDVHVEGFTNYADVSWRPPVQGTVKGYDVAFWPADNPSAKRKTKVKAPADRGSIEGLKRGTKYIVVVKSVVEGLKNQGADEKAFYTVPSQPSMGNIDTSPVSITLKWSRKKDEPNVTEAIVTYWQPGSTQQTKRVSTRDPQQLLIYPLKPNTCIEGYVELVCGDKTSNKTHWSATTGMALKGMM
ncbi:fibronectin-like [Lingula anatina]|uniref:Fibronectin-like n=1 Tax=Lingula anatina TaxID=7574 RepID=A0A1S3IBF9_LINAN|nr:fibronectin-like [Lingula anatina]|eukprot:XP_013395595.1 fibronectin-like [Lingula anatina]